METILVPVDFSDHSEYALEVAAGIAKRQNAEIVVLHMLALHESYLTSDEKNQTFNEIYFTKLTKEKFEKFLAKDYLKDIRVTEAVKYTKAFSQIDDVANEYRAELIVMGSHGASGLKEIFVGSNTEKVVRTAKVPVLVIKERMPDFKIEKAVFVTDFEVESKSAYIAARDFFKFFGIEPELLFVNLPEKFMSSSEMRSDAQKFMEEAGADTRKLMEKIHFYDDYTLENGVFNFCNANKIDLIAIPTHGRKGIAHFFYGSIGEDIANHAKIPVLTCRI